MKPIHTVIPSYNSKTGDKFEDKSVKVVFVPFVNEPLFIKSIKEGKHPEASDTVYLIDGYTVDGTIYEVIVHQAYSNESLHSEYPSIKESDTEKILTMLRTLLFKSDISQKDSQAIMNLVVNMEKQF